MDVGVGCLGNIIWFLCGGGLNALSWFVMGLLWSITIIGIPIGVQCFKLASLSCFPFGKDVTYGGGPGSFFLNLLWLVATGLPMAIEHFAIGLLLCITIIGIPFGLQQFKLAKLSLMPFGTELS